MKNKHFINLIILSLTSAILLACGSKNNTEQQKQANGFSVKTSVVNIDSSGKQNYYIGTAEASQTVAVSFASVGTVARVNVSEGQAVGKGQVLATLNNTSYKSSLDMSEAMEAQARDAYNRLNKVYKEGSLPEVKFVEIDSKLKQAVSAKQIAQKNYSDCVLKSPISGVIGVKSVEPGSNALPMTPAFTIYQIDKILVKIPVPENEIAKIKKGMRAQIIIPALDNRLCEGAVKEIGIIANPVSHTYDVKVEISNSKKEIKPGMICNIYLNSVSSNSAISIPANSIQSNNGEQFVFVLNSDNKSVRKQIVVPGNYNGNNIYIKSGLNPGDKIIVSGQQKLYDNAIVIPE